MRYPLGLAFVVFVLSVGLHAHDIGSTPITWNREISRLIYDKCASCHRDGGTSFSLMTYQEVQPRAVAVRDAVLARRMPPWGAVKGFGTFRNDTSLTQEQIELVTNWVEQDTPRGNNRRSLPPIPTFAKPGAQKADRPGLPVSGTMTLAQAITLDGVLPDQVPDGESMKVTAILPGGRVEPLVWLYAYKGAYRHAFLFRRPLDLPAGTIIEGVPLNARLLLLSAPSTKAWQVAQINSYEQFMNSSGVPSVLPITIR
jgi:hypothetical protein